MSVPTIETKAPAYIPYVPPVKADEQDLAQKRADAVDQPIHQHTPSQQQVQESDLLLFRELFIRGMAETEVRRDLGYFTFRECYWDPRSIRAQEEEIIQRNSPLTYQDLFLRAVTNRGGYPYQEVRAAQEAILKATKK